MQKTILITGSTGMIGKNLINAFIKLNYRNIIITYQKKSKIKDILDIKKELKKIKINLVSSIETKKKLYKIKPNIIFHLVASNINSNILEQHYEKNIYTTINLINAINLTKLEQIIYTNTGSIYGQGNLVSENSKININENYSYTKYVTSLFLKNFCLGKKILYKEFRIFSVYGKYEDKKRLVSGAIYSAIKNKNFYLRSKNQIRDYINVEDIVEALIKSIKIKRSFIVNLCSGNEIGTHNLVKRVFIFNKIKINKIKYNKNNKGYSKKKLTGKNIKIKKILNWKPKINLDNGIKLTTEWLKKNEKMYSM